MTDQVNKVLDGAFNGRMVVGAKQGASEGSVEFTLDGGEVVVFKPNCDATRHGIAIEVNGKRIATA